MARLVVVVVVVVAVGVNSQCFFLSFFVVAYLHL